MIVWFVECGWMTEKKVFCIACIFSNGCHLSDLLVNIGHLIYSLTYDRMARETLGASRRLSQSNLLNH